MKQALRFAVLAFIGWSVGALLAYKLIEATGHTCPQPRVDIAP